MTAQKTFLALGATGQTGQHFVRLALDAGHRVRALARTPAKLTRNHPELEVVSGSITDGLDLDALVPGCDFIVVMLGNAEAQRDNQINTAFMRELVPAMRRQGVTRLLYQAGGLSTPPGEKLPLALQLVRATIARSYIGQHEDNEAVMRYLDDEARDIEWMVHRAGIGSDKPSKGVLQRSSTAFSIGTFVDCAEYTLRTVQDAAAVHTCSPSTYRKADASR
ncbi:NAD(P)-dependent oxidoreductase [Agreia sp. COWG]|uniref:NAD(P)-dependent oxidoreductase n=1 Tax=Agreia sp. COWG TaxID=2773266 RepID=UPI001928A24F|nr:NAD(P)H-binding protein [Agreia sp. COWG]CAD5990993.1 NmrA family transcriptional regulator [Agreia sp. COWG]